MSGARIMNNLHFDTSHIESKPIRAAFDDAAYPQRVKSLMGDKAPAHLDMLGNLDILDSDGLGFCGSRKSSAKGLETVQDCAEQAAHKDIAVISGNAAGIDFAAHYHCLKEGGKTIMVIPEGINHFRIRKALRDVWDWNRVLVISQFAPDEPWQVYRAMTRNQLIIALSRAMIVIEAGEKGGTLHAGKETLKSQLPLYVVQYADMSVAARGNQSLLDMGAHGLAKSKSTNRANLEKVFASMKEREIHKKPALQEHLL